MATNPDIDIKTITKASIKLDPVIALDRTNDGEYTKEETWDVDAKQTGFYRPYISINGFRIDPGLTHFNLDNNGFMPVCNFTFTMQDAAFLSASYPKDGDVFSIYIRAIGEVYKPIRMDFNVLSVDAVPIQNERVGNTDGLYQTFTILGECRIPGLYTHRIKAFRDKTSYDTLLEVSQDLGLGFSSNDNGLTDTMTWICPNFSYYDFINDVTKHAYKDEFSYFGVWVDLYYNLNFVNLGNQFAKENMQLDSMVGPDSGQSPLDTGDDSGLPGRDIKLTEMPLILSNAELLVGSPLFIEGYTLLSDSGQSSNEAGYVTTLQFYDTNSQLGEDDGAYAKYTIESITTENISDATLLQKGRPTENLYKNEKRSVWIGQNKTGDSSTTHLNYNHAKVQNKINLLDSMKFNLNVEFSKYMPFIYKGQVVPVQMFVREKGLRKLNTGTGTETSNDGMPIMDQFLSGLYVVTGYEVIYNKRTGKIRQRLNLRKKTWTLNTAGNLPKYYPIETGVGDAGIGGVSGTPDLPETSDLTGGIGI